MGWPAWTGLGERRWTTEPNEQVQPSKTLWDVLQLLIVPVILVGITLLWTTSQTKSDNKREDRRIAADRAAAEQVRQDTTLDDYIQQMSDLMLDKKLPFSKRGDAVRSVARTVTLTTLRRLDGQRKGEVVRFLQEARLIANGGFRVDLAGADLTRADLTRADLAGANLGGANLAGADLTGADVLDANLSGSDLTGANLTDANLLVANLTRAVLLRADLTGADLGGADLLDANLTGAHLGGADLTGANLKGVRGLPKRKR